ncbi:MAG: hypothetical protein D8M59_03045 [Planctomycetes bacterium]|nr:hypothetical protein [Planctomycetota bacterium]NOG52969.1 hypothetical protein [Planctomycetota bacterium]
MEPSPITTEFAQSVLKVLDTMLQVHGVLAGGIDSDTPRPVIGVEAGLDGDFHGRFSLSMHEDTASALVRLFTGEPHRTCDDDFSDALTELMSITSGNTKAGMPGCLMQIARPRLIWEHAGPADEDQDLESRSLRETMWCGTDCGNIKIGVTLTSPGAPGDHARRRGGAGS